MNLLDNFIISATVDGVIRTFSIARREMLGAFKLSELVKYHPEFADRLKDVGVGALGMLTWFKAEGRFMAVSYAIDLRTNLSVRRRTSLSDWRGTGRTRRKRPRTSMILRQPTTRLSRPRSSPMSPQPPALPPAALSRPLSPQAVRRPTRFPQTAARAHLLLWLARPRPSLLSLGDPTSSRSSISPGPSEVPSRLVV